MKPKFTHLHVHSHYSLLDGLPKIDDLLDYAQELGMDTIALTDHGNLYGAIEFYQKAKQRGIKPILGCELYVAKNKMSQKSSLDKKNYHLIALVANKEGYKNLIQLVTKANLEGFYYKPRVDEELLEKHHQGLIVLSACLQGKIPYLIRAGKYKEAKKAALRYQEIFGKENFYLEIQYHPSLPDQILVNENLIKLSRETGIPLVATNDVHYLKIEDAEAQEILRLVNMKSTVNDTNRAFSMLGENFAMRSPQKMIELFKDVPEAIKNTNLIAKRCNFELELGKLIFPKYKVPEGKTAKAYIRELCLINLDKKYKKKKPREDALKRLNYELGVIEKLKFIPYFLIVQDFVKWAKDHHIVVGPGRGSAPGSIVSFLLDITEIDPLKYNLIFERFLNPSRISMPDIDLDFADERRDEVIDYIAKKYGRHNVAQIITFGTMASRGVIRDVGRALGYSYELCDKIAKMIPMNFPLEKAFSEIAQLKQLYNEDQKVKKLVDLAKKLEGTVRHASTHACGVVVSDQPLSNTIPLQHPPQDKESIITQYEMHSIEDLGLLKVDLLGLRNLSVIEDTLARIYAVQGKNLVIEDIPLNDKKTYQLLQRADTTGIFQLESSGMKSYLKQLEPSKFEDIIAMIALYRPGPMQFIPRYIARKKKEEKPTYIHPDLKPILQETYGVAVYQEQIMQIAHKLALFTLAEADILRKAIGKKIAKLLNKQKDKFIQGMQNNKIPKETAQEIWNWIKPFARYSFNLSHAASYATIAYRTAYLKAHYPVEFMAAVLTSHQGNNEKVASLIDTCRRMKIEVLPPDINESFHNFSVVPSVKKIRFGLSAIKNVGQKVVEAIIKERKNNGPFQNFEDFLQRIAPIRIDKRSMEDMARTGVFDNLIERSKIINNVGLILNHLKELQERNTSHQASLFSGNSNENMLSLHLPPGENTSKKQELDWEKELLGLYISANPLDRFKDALKKEATPISFITCDLVGRRVKIGGIITKIHKILTKNNKQMLFAEIEDFDRKIEVVVFPDILKESQEIFVRDKIILIQGLINNRNDSLKIICESAKEINQSSV